MTSVSADVSRRQPMLSSSAIDNGDDGGFVFPLPSQAQRSADVAPVPAVRRHRSVVLEPNDYSSKTAEKTTDSGMPIKPALRQSKSCTTGNCKQNGNGSDVIIDTESSAPHNQPSS